MRIRRILSVMLLVCLSVLYIQANWPTHLDFNFVVYGQSGPTAPCTVCPFIATITPAQVVAGATQLVIIDGLNLDLGSLTVAISGNDVTATPTQMSRSSAC